MWRALGVLVLLNVFSTVTCGRDAAHVGLGYCLRLEDVNQLKLEFRIVLNGDANAEVTGRDGPTASNDCNIVLTDGIRHDVTSLIDLSTDTAVSNDCGFSVTTDGNNNKIYTWEFWYREFPNRPDLDVGINRYYTVACNSSIIPGNRVEAPVQVDTPNLNQDVTQRPLNFGLQILYEISDDTYSVYTDASPRLAVGTPIKLRLSLNYGTFVAFTPSGIAGLFTEADRDDTFNTNNREDFFNTTGCPISDQTPKRSPDVSHGYLKVSDGPSVSIHETDPFPIWAYPGSSEVWFRTYVAFCSPDNLGTDQFCNDPCNNPRNRRRRADEGEEEIIVVGIRVYDPENTTEQQKDTESDTDAILIGSVVGAGVVLIILVVIACCLVAAGKRRRREK